MGRSVSRLKTLLLTTQWPDTCPKSIRKLVGQCSLHSFNDFQQVVAYSYLGWLEMNYWRQYCSTCSILLVYIQLQVEFLKFFQWEKIEGQIRCLFLLAVLTKFNVQVLMSNSYIANSSKKFFLALFEKNILFFFFFNESDGSLKIIQDYFGIQKDYKGKMEYERV